MNKETEEKLARSLTAETTELLPFLPYLLQDFWELGSNPRDMARLIKKHLPLSEESRILDLACGKGAVSIHIAREFKVRVYGFDLMPEFIEYARQKAEEYEVGGLCRFALGDANDIVNRERDYDCTIFGAAGNILGSPRETLRKLAQTVGPQGCILIDDAYLPDDASNAEVKYKNYTYLTRAEWLRLFEKNGLLLLEELPNTEGYNFEAENKALALRAQELTAKHPEKAAVFAGYVQSQLNECADLESTLTGGTWILQKT